MKDHLGWYSRDYLPHFDKPGFIQGITFRLADSMPAEVIARWRDELAHLPEGERKSEFQSRISDYLDAGHGECLLRDRVIAQLVENALLHFDGERYRLIAWVVMPNHVHALAEMHDGWPMADVVHSCKKFHRARGKQAPRAHWRILAAGVSRPIHPRRRAFGVCAELHRAKSGESAAVRES